MAIFHVLRSDRRALELATSVLIHPSAKDRNVTLAEGPVISISADAVAAASSGKMKNIATRDMVQGKE